MSGFLFSFLAVILAGIGARDQLAVAGLSARQGQRPAVLMIAILLSAATAVAAAWMAQALAPQLPAKARLAMAVLALGFAAGECLLLAPARQPKEPTNSLGALAVVVAAHQITDAARFLVFAIALAGAAPIPAGAGGAVGGAVTVTAGWLLPALATEPGLRLARRLIGAGFAVLALFMAGRIFIG